MCNYTWNILERSPCQLITPFTNQPRSPRLIFRLRSICLVAEHFSLAAQLEQGPQGLDQGHGYLWGIE